MLSRPAAAAISRSPPDADRKDALEDALALSWSQLLRAHDELDDPEHFDHDANALLPTIALSSVRYAIEALAVAMHQPAPDTGDAAPGLIGSVVSSGVLPYPWGITCSGCPQNGTATFDGLPHTPRTVDVHSHADPSSSCDRLAMFLRTTRAQELERRFVELRRLPPAAGKKRRVVPRAEKEAVAAGVDPTTLFDVLWRTRRESHTTGIDRFVVGAADETEARRFAEALVIITDATVAAIEAVIAATIGTVLPADMTGELIERSAISQGSRLGHHATSWRNRTIHH